MLRLATLLLALVSTSATGASLPTSRIINGDLVREGLFPWVVSLRHNDVHFCGGSIINTKWILTAAACLTGEIVQVSSTSVVANTLQLNSGGDRYQASSFVIHSGWDANTMSNNIALLQVATDIVYKSGAQPARLPNDLLHWATISWLDPFPVAGWGSASNSEGGVSNELLYFGTIARPEFECTYHYPHHFSEEQFCTSTGANRGICQGDLGGPIMYANGTLLGILSHYKVPCASSVPDVATRVFSHKNWIESVVGH